MRKKLKGLGGWLLFYIIIEISGLVVLIAEVLGSRFFLKLTFLEVFGNSFIELSMFLIAFLFSIFVLVLIFKKSKNARSLNMTYLGLSFLFVVLRIFYLTSEPLKTLLLFSLIYNAIWLAYWHKSVRVKNTFAK